MDTQQVRMSVLFGKIYPLFENVAIPPMGINNSKKAKWRARKSAKQINELPKDEQDFLLQYKDDFWLKFNIKNSPETNKIACALPITILKSDYSFVVSNQD